MPSAPAPRIWVPYTAEELGYPEARFPQRLGPVAVVPTIPLDGDGKPVLPEGAETVEFFTFPYLQNDRGAALLSGLPRLRVAQTLTAGVDNVLPLLPSGVTLCNARGVHDASTAELALALALASLRGLPRFVRDQDRGVWDQTFHTSLADRTVLIVGYGSIGEAIERRLLPFEVADVVRVARSARTHANGPVHAFTELPELLPSADVVVLVLPLTEESRQLVDAGFLARMKDGALLVNVARGPIVDTAALLAELGSGRISAALDVTDPEPLPAGHPLWSAPNVLISPHVGGASTAFGPRARRLVRAQLDRLERGELPANAVAGPGA
ncbi:dihydrofolate reductase [Mangrovactinospora gilvigrisea]|uniref:Dihydrofolate reductase n=1 Tax=Mangrovactinospora gilvigrisea TaxID=1428644 RepID=A0A1J7BDJ1_9ACTN|nr:2-hydroxyacid dehydrogenase [Mangrovactinospora gilvigrisea]OIV36747.1 dihydrofolate reductase [Mangrovactinospora gilvigrisea]